MVAARKREVRVQDREIETARERKREREPRQGEREARARVGIRKVCQETEKEIKQRKKNTYIYI